jgi:hypothetical protein
MERKLALRAHFGNVFNTTMLAVTMVAIWGGILAILITLIFRG